MRKILYVHHGSGRGGAPQSLLYLIQGLDKARFEASIACGFAEPHAAEFFRGNGFDPIDIPTARFCHVSAAEWGSLYNPRAAGSLLKWLLVRQPAAALRLKRVLREVRPDLVHLNSLTLAFLAPVVRHAGIPVVLHVRESASVHGHFGLRWRWLRNIAENVADHVIYICRENRDSLTGAVPNATVVYNPVPFDRFDRKLDRIGARETLGIRGKETTVLFPGGSVDEPKGIIPFLQALGRVLKEGRDVLGLVPGIEAAPHRWRGRFRRKVEDVIQMNGLEDALVRLPFSDQVERYFAASDIVVAPFIAPHFSRAVIEAGAMAKPVIGSRIGGVEEVIQDGVTGVLVLPGDVTDLSRALSGMIAEPEARVRLGEEGYRVAVESYRAETHAQRVMAIYGMILG